MIVDWKTLVLQGWCSYKIKSMNASFLCVKLIPCAQKFYEIKNSSKQFLFIESFPNYCRGLWYSAFCVSRITAEI